MGVGRSTLMGTLLVLCGLWLSACGPDTIFLRPGLDTPAQHVANGNVLLKQNKLEAAFREFNRAQMLEPNFAPAHVGLGKIWGLRGDFEKGNAALDKADAVARGESERQAVSEGRLFLDELAGAATENVTD
jgi:tetratricopeptide (TPR) repeat protein